MSAPVTSPRILGKPVDRVDGRLKVTGAAKYAVEFNPDKVAHAYAVMSTISKGKIKSIDTSDAEKAPGVLAVLTHLNALKMAEPKPDREHQGGIRDEDRIPLSDDVISYGGQYVALAVADTFERAKYAASLVRVGYDVQPHALTWDEAPGTATKPEQEFGENLQAKKGDAAGALADANLVRIENTYETPAETHNPMEPSGTVAVWKGPDTLLLYDATQYVKGVQDVLAGAFGLKRENVRVICPFVGGAFGCKGAVWMHVILAAMAAKVAGVPVKLAVTRPGMFSGTGHRTPTRQTIALAATKEGRLQAIRHRAETVTSPVGDHVESCAVRSTGVLYNSPAIALEETLYKINVASTTFMRAPGECPGTYAVECAMDELAYALKMDPLKLREINYSEVHPIKGKPWSTKHLKEAYQLGAEKFGWGRRTPEPRSMKDGRMLVGWGVATATYPAHKMTAAARIRLNADGTALVQCASHDLGTGAYTAFTQISAEALGLSMDKVKFELGDSDLPYGPVAGGSNSTATVGTAICDAATALGKNLAQLAVRDKQSPLHGAKATDVVSTPEGRLALKSDASKNESFTDILRRSGKEFAEGEVGVKSAGEQSPKAFQSFGVHFCEVKIDPDLPRVQVTRVVPVMDCGRVINAKTARSQILGGVVMGIGMALEEETVYDKKTGLPATRNLADYHVPVNADIISIEPYFVGEPDFEFTPMGSRGMGEIGITGIAAAVANAVYHATGKRVRDLPITLDKLM